MKHNIDLVVGDWSSDGHGISSSVPFIANFPLEDVEKFHAQAAKQHGLDFATQCEDYEDSCLSEDFLEAALIAFANHPTALSFFQELVKEDGYVKADEFCFVYMYIAELGQPLLKWQHVEGNPSIAIGGYGLFSN